jgi:hypothetical protein
MMILRLIPPGEIAAILLVVTPGLVGEREAILLVVTPGLEGGITEGSRTVVEASASSDLVFLQGSRLVKETCSANKK